MKSNSNNSAKRRKLEDEFPNEATVTGINENPTNPDNKFRHLDPEQVAKRFVQLHVIMEYLNQILDLPPNATVENLALSIRDLMIANKQKNHADQE